MIPPRRRQQRRVSGERLTGAAEDVVPTRSSTPSWLMLNRRGYAQIDSRADRGRQIYLAALSLLEPVGL